MKEMWMLTPADCDVTYNNDDSVWYICPGLQEQCVVLDELYTIVGSRVGKYFRVDEDVMLYIDVDAAEQALRDYKIRYYEGDSCIDSIIGELYATQNVIWKAVCKMRDSDEYPVALIDSFIDRVERKVRFLKDEIEREA